MSIIFREKKGGVLHGSLMGWVLDLLIVKYNRRRRYDHDVYNGNSYPFFCMNTLRWWLREYERFSDLFFYCGLSGLILILICSGLRFLRVKLMISFLFGLCF